MEFESLIDYVLIEDVLFPKLGRNVAPPDHTENTTQKEPLTKRALVTSFRERTQARWRSRIQASKRM